jgi:hypothetical protein
MKFLSVQLRLAFVTSSLLGRNTLSLIFAWLKKLCFTPTERYAKLIFLYLMSTTLVANWKGKNFEMNSSKHSPNLTCSSFVHKCNFELLLSFQNTYFRSTLRNRNCALTHFQRFHQNLLLEDDLVWPKHVARKRICFNNILRIFELTF